jgi:lysophospholipase
MRSRAGRDSTKQGKSGIGCGLPASLIALNFPYLSFVVGTSSTLFNMGLVQKLQTTKEEDLGFFTGAHDLKDDIVEEVFKYLDETKDDIASYPNPFRKWTEKENPLETVNDIQLVDGGEAEENIPIDPFLQADRHVDAIFAFDNSADQNNWPTGQSLTRTYEKAVKQASLYNGKVRMPRVPATSSAFVNAGLNTRPVFFGCEDKEVPTVIYIPNYSWSTASNTDTFKLEYSLEETLAMIENGRRSLDLNGTVRDWGRCLTCAMWVFSRSVWRGTYSSITQD